MLWKMISASYLDAIRNDFKICPSKLKEAFALFNTTTLFPHIPRRTRTNNALSNHIPISMANPVQSFFILFAIISVCWTSVADAGGAKVNNVTPSMARTILIAAMSHEMDTVASAVSFHTYLTQLLS